MKEEARKNQFRLINERTGNALAEQAEAAESFLARARGLLGRSGLSQNEALVIPSCKCVHMFFMTFPIDVVYCSADHRVVGLQPNLRPWRMSNYVAAADYVIELPANKIESAGLEIGDTIRREALR